MIIHPDLRALRGNDAPQRVAQETIGKAMDAWRAREHVAALLGEIDAFAGGRPIAGCPGLAALFAPGEAALRFAGEFSAVALAGLAEAPLGHLPLRHFTDGLTSTLLLARARNVTLALVAIDGASLCAKPPPVTVDFSPSEMWEHVLAGEARAEHIVHRDGAPPERRPVELRPGIVTRRDASRDALQIREVAGRLVLLRLQRRRGDAGPAREYRLDDGRLVHQAAGDPRDSRLELMMALLGRMRRADAAPLLAAIALEDGSTAPRWQALRECLALDTLAGFTALSEIARSAGDALAAPAGALRAQLVETYPQLDEVASCPA